MSESIILPTQEERALTGVIDASPGADCNCEFDLYDDGSDGESYHYKRSCYVCGNPFWSTHCIHEGRRSCGSVSCYKVDNDNYERFMLEHGGRA